MYYFCRQDLFDSRGMIDIVGHTPVTGKYLWTAGEKFAAPVPVQTLKLDTSYGDKFPAFFDTTIPLMSNELIDALQAAGVDNFDCYPMILERDDTGQTYTDYQAVNVVGRIDALDEEQSESDHDEISPRYSKIMIDPAKTHELKCFRLKTGPDLLVIRQEVAEHLSRLSFKALLLQRTEDFDGD
jgi:hypothetical protein